MRVLLLSEPEVLVLRLARTVEGSVGVGSDGGGDLRMGLEHGGRLQVGRQRMTVRMRVSSVRTAEDLTCPRATGGKGLVLTGREISCGGGSSGGSGLRRSDVDSTPLSHSDAHCTRVHRLAVQL